MRCTDPMTRAEAIEILSIREIAAAVRSRMRANGARGGRAAAAAMTAEQRSQRARNAANARHAKRRPATRSGATP